MTAKAMERRLVELGERFVTTHDPKVQAEYRALHAEWMATKANGDHTKTTCNRVVTDERGRLRDHVTTVIPTEYARVNSTGTALTRKGMESSGHVVTAPVPQENPVEQCGHQLDGYLTGPLAVQCPECEAPPGEPCRRQRDDRPSQRIHSDRRDELSFQRLLAANRPRLPWASLAAGKALLKAADRQPCPLCGKPMLIPLAHIDHIIPLGIGGPDSLANLRVICRDCNLGRPRDGSDLDSATLATSRRGRRI